MSRPALKTHHDPMEGVDPAGMIRTGARRAAIPDAFKPLLDAAMAAVKAMPGAPSLHVYGSVATGRARVGLSDVDLVALGLDAAAARQLGHELTARFPGLCRGVEIGAAALADYAGPGDEAFGNRVFLRHYCVHLMGPHDADAVPDVLPMYPADTLAMRGFNGDIGMRAQQWRCELPSADPGLLGRRMARKTLFAVAGLVSHHDATWTTDRVAAAQRWSALRPALATALAALVAWGDAWPAKSSRPDLQRALDGVVADVVAAFRDRIGLWA